MKASDIAYMIALIEKAPSTYPRREKLIEELQDIYNAAQGRRYGADTYRVPVMPSIGVMEVDRG